MPLISIVTITFNNFTELVETLRSTEDITGIENVVVNGGSCQSTREFLLEKGYVHVSEPDKGISDAFNKGIRLSKGSAIMFLNSGDRLVDAQFVSEAALKLKEYDYVFCDSMFLDGTAGKLFMPADDAKNLGRGMPFCHQSLIVNRKVFEQIGVFDLQFKAAMCFDFVCRLKNMGARGWYYHGAAVEVDGTGISSSQEARVLTESKTSLKRNNLWKMSQRFAFGRRELLYRLRATANKFGLGPLLVRLKKLKYRSF